MKRSREFVEWHRQATAAQDADRPVLEELPTAGTRSGARHLPGKHNQKTHGHGLGFGGEAAPGWREIRDADEREATVKRLRTTFPSMSGLDAEAMSEELCPPGTRIFENGNGVRLEVMPNATITDEQVTQTMETVSDLDSRFPHPIPTKGDPAYSGVAITVIEGSRMSSEATMGETIRFNDESSSMTLNDAIYGYAPKQAQAIRDMGAVLPKWRHPDSFYDDPVKGTITHEWAHVIQPAGDTKADLLYQENLPHELGAGGLFGYSASGGPKEAYAEAFMDFVTTPAGKRMSTTANYAEAYGWEG